MKMKNEMHKEQIAKLKCEINLKLAELVEIISDNCEVYIIEEPEHEIPRLDGKKFRQARELTLTIKETKISYL
jgi:hypothetical protein